MIKFNTLLIKDNPYDAYSYQDSVLLSSIRRCVVKLFQSPPDNYAIDIRDLVENFIGDSNRILIKGAEFYNGSI